MAANPALALASYICMYKLFAQTHCHYKPTIDRVRITAGFAFWGTNVTSEWHHNEKAIVFDVIFRPEDAVFCSPRHFACITVSPAVTPKRSIHKEWNSFYIFTLISMCLDCGYKSQSLKRVRLCFSWKSNGMLSKWNILEKIVLSDSNLVIIDTKKK